MVETKLVNQIVRQVVAALEGGASGGARGAVGRTTTEPAKPQAAGRPTESQATGAREREKKVFITEEMLSRRISTGGGVVKLAHNEHLTPAAVDLAEGKHLTVTRAPAPMIVPSASPSADVPAAAPGSPGTIGLVVDRADAKVASVVTSLGYDGLDLADYTAGECWLENLRGLCDAVGRGVVAAGVVILPHGADAMVVANKIRGVRAVQGTRMESVAAALRHFDANVLILEHAFSMFHEMRAMVRMFAAERTAAGASGVVLGAIDKLERT